MKRITNINVDPEAWNDVRRMIGGRRISDRHRSIIIKDILEEVDFRKKLKPELTDTPHDKILKKISRRII